MLWLPTIVMAGRDSVSLRVHETGRLRTMRCMTVYERGDVVLVRFPLPSATMSKQRPAIVISSDTYNQNSLDVMIASITSQLVSLSHPGDRVITDWKGAGLLKPSLA